ncbi:MAG: ATP-binding protein [Ignavibacteriaceae bacterium]|nr:ATP-binding protein [Ignavibacteriaceae bacterium]
MKAEKSKQNKNMLEIKSRTENLAAIRSFINSAATEAGLTKEVIDNIILAVDEACTNIIKHAYKYSPDGRIIITLKPDKKTFTVEIIDYGKSFDPNIVPNPDLQKYVDQGRVGGLGMYLMKTLMDEVKYYSVPGKFNQVSLSKYINSNGR